MSTKGPEFDFDSTSPELNRGDIEIYDAMRQVGPIAWSPRHGGHWVAVGHSICRQVAGDPQFSSASGVHVPNTALHERGISIFALEHDEPEHRAQRKVLQQAVGDKPSSVPTDLIRQHARRRIAEFDRSIPVDLMAGFANPLPLDVVFAVTGADDEFKPEMKALVDAGMFRREPVPGVEDPAARIHEIASLIVQRHIAHPVEDWISELATASINGDPLSEPDMVAAVVSLITGGHHSTSRGLGSLIARILTVPGLQDRLRSDPGDIPIAIDETLRLHTPLPSFSRRATQATPLEGIAVEPGEDVLLVYAAANRDPEVFDEAEQFRMDRPRHDHLAFGYGPHRCVGIHLAKAELRIATEELLLATPLLELAEPIAWRGPAEPEALMVRMQ